MLMLSSYPSTMLGASAVKKPSARAHFSAGCHQFLEAQRTPPEFVGGVTS